VIVEEVVTSLEMTSESDLVPARPPPEPVELVRAGAAEVEEVRRTCARIGEPHGWVTRPAWTAAQWDSWLRRPGVQVWLARVGGEPAGLVDLVAQDGGDVEIAVFGLVPEMVGRGFGGHLLTEGTRLAWRARHPAGGATRRVWLQTSSRDHPHAIVNYERRGYRRTGSEQRRRVVPDR
jgi:GNAT superfamily N-acetyltransferase